MDKILSALFIAIVLFGCTSEEPSSSGTDPLPEGAKGIYIVNEGNYNSSNSTLTFIVPDSSKVYPDIFFSSTKTDLGDNANDVVIDNGKVFIVVNNSHRIEVLSAETHAWLGTISLPSNSPYKIAVYSPSKAYVTNFKKRSVSVFNPTTLAVRNDSIRVGNDPTGILLVNNKIYVCNSGGLTPDSTISVINPASDKVIKTIVVGLGPNEIAVDSDGEILVLCSGKFNAVPSAVYTIDPTTDTVKNIMTIPMSTLGNPYKFALSNKGYGLLPSFGSVAKFDTKSNTIISADFIHRSAYGIAIDNVTEKIYVSDAADYVSPGTLYVFDKNAVPKDSVAVGINPGTIVFRR